MRLIFINLTATGAPAPLWSPPQRRLVTVMRPTTRVSCTNWPGLTGPGGVNSGHHSSSSGMSSSGLSWCRWRGSLRLWLWRRLLEGSDVLTCGPTVLGMLLLTLTEPNSSWDDLASAVSRTLRLSLHPARRHKGRREQSSLAIPRPGLSRKSPATRSAVGVARS